MAAALAKVADAKPPLRALAWVGRLLAGESSWPR
jgi:hypothetical protein